MIPRDLWRQVRHIEITTTRLVNDLFGGEYESVFKGRGIEFADVREYVVGDDIRSIDWNVTARTGHPFVKQFVEERELTVFFCIDRSRSTLFGTREKLKSEAMAEICALLAFAAVKNNDKVGCVLFSDTVERIVPPKKGKQHVLRVVREVLYHEAQGRRSNLSDALEYALRILTRSAILFVVSDFQAQGFERALAVVSARHDVIALAVTDPAETDLPASGLVHLEDPETGEWVLLDTSSARVRTEFARAAAARRSALETLFRKMAIDKVDLQIGQSYVEPLFRFFKERERRR